MTRAALQVFLLLVAVVLPSRVEAVICTTTSDGTISDTQTKINSAVDGDTVCLPNGAFTWATPLTITNQRVTVSGATECILSDETPPITVPLCSTSITGNVGAQPIINVTTCSASDFVTLAHFTLRIQAAGSSSGMVNIDCENSSGYPPIAFRVHHVQFDGDATDGTTNNSSSGRWFFANAVYGLLDHDQFLAQTARGVGNVSSGRDGSVSTCHSYHHPFSLGDQNAVYIEDSFAYSNFNGQGNGFTDNYSGGRIVVRMSTIYNNNFGIHGFDSQLCGVPTFEGYGLIFKLENGAGSGILTQMRSGTGVLWGIIVQHLGASSSFTNFYGPDYYAALTPSNLSGTAWLNSRASNAFGGRYYASGSWAANPIAGVTTKDDGIGNFLTGSNALDGNQFTNGSMDADYTRTVTNLNTTSGSKTITSASISFVAGDLDKRIYGTNVKAGRVIADANWSVSGTTITCASCNFSTGDVGRLVGDIGATISGSVTIASVTDSSHAVMSASASAGTDGALILVDCYLTTINSSTSADMNCNADGTTTTGTLTVGYTNQGYPALDQPGRGYFETANSGSWPSSSTYTDANFQKPMPVYLWANRLQSSGGSWGLPPATEVFHNGVQGYVKANREYFDPIDYAVEPSSTFDGTTGTGIGPIANRPSTCTATTLAGGGTVGVGYWAVDEGTWNQGSFNYTFPHNGNTYTQGQLYRCAATNEWSLYYTPLTYPHPLAGGAPPPPARNFRGLRIRGQ